MESWTRVIVEWINCLGIAQPFIEVVHDLKDYVVFGKLVSELCSRNNEASTITQTAIISIPVTPPSLNERERVSEFIKAEYPDFVISNQCLTVVPDELYIASLLLTYCSQKVTFHRPMCTNLKHETQIRIKKFLELVLSYGRSVTKEIIDVAIMEIGDATPTTLPSTPTVRPLREFFNSPAARSAQSQRYLNDRNRELRRLKAQLETEQFEKADLTKDIRIQEEKIQNLQKKLREKTQELKALRCERSMLTTPQSCRKDKRPSDNEERYKRELEQSENVNLGLQSEIEKLRDEMEELSHRFTSKSRLYSALKEKFDQCERNTEALSIQLEMKTNELLNLRMNNEELREHIREIQRSSMGEQSFEMEPINRARSPFVLNSSEALSSIVDIQLQEAKKESEQLNNQLDVMNRRLEIALRESNDIKQLNAVLQEKVTELNGVSVSLRNTEIQLSSSIERAKNLELEKIELMENLTKLDTALTSNKELLALAENRSNAFETKLADATLRNQHLEVSLEEEKSRKAELESTVLRLKEERNDLHTQLAINEDKLIRVNKSKTAIEFDLNEKLEKLVETENALINEKSQVTELQSIVTSFKKESEDLKIKLGISEKSFFRVSEEKEKLEIKLQEKNMKIEDAETRLKSEGIRIDELESTVARVKDEYEILQNLLKSCEENLSRVNEDKKNLEFNLEKNTKSLKELEIRLDNEKSTVAKLESTITRIDNESENLKHQLASSEENLLKLKEKNKSLELNLEENEKGLKEREDSLNKEKVRVVELESTIFHLQRNSDDLKNELRSTKDSLSVEKARIIDLESTVACGKKNTNDLEEMLEKLSTELENEKLASSELKEIVSLSKTNCQELESLLRSKEELLEESLERTSSLNAELETCRLRINDLELSLRSEISKSVELNNECSRTKEHCVHLKNELVSKEHILAETEMTKRDREHELDKVKAEMQVIERDLLNLREKCSQLKEEQKQSLLVNEKMEKYARNADEKIVSLVAKIAEYESKIEEYDEKTKSDKQNMKILHDDLTYKNSTIDELSVRLEEAEKREITIAFELETTKKRLAELTELGEEMESQLAQEKDQLFAIRVEKKRLKEELTLCVSTEANLKEQINKINEELKNSNENLQKQIVTNATLKKNELKLEERKCELENKLAEEQRLSSITLNEKLNLEQELASYVESAANMKKTIGQMEKELNECDTKLRQELEANSALKKDNIVIKELGIKLENELAILREQLMIIRTEKHSLEEKISLYVLKASDMEGVIEKIQKDLEVSIKNEKEQRKVIVALEEKVCELEEVREALKNELANEKEQLMELRNEKEMLEEEAALYGRSNEDLGKKLITLQAELEKYHNDMENEREMNATLKKIEIESKNERDKLRIELTEEREDLEVVRTEKKNLEEKLSAYMKSRAETTEKISVLHAELEKSRKDVQQLRENNEKLKENVTELDTRIETLRVYETQSKQLNSDLEIAREQCATSRKKVKKLSETLELRVKELTNLERQFEEAKQEKDRLSMNLEENIRTSSDIVASLKKSLLETEKSYAEAKLEEKLKEESLEVVRIKLEQSTKEKIESELKMKEIIVNLQEVRRSQDEVLEAQAKTLKKKSCQLEEAEKEVAALKISLTTNASKIDGEKLMRRETEVQCEKLRERNVVQSKLVKELEIALEIERNQVEESKKRCRLMDNDVKEITRVSRDLKLEFNALWNCTSKVCPEIVEKPRQVVDDFNEDLENIEIQGLTKIMQCFTDDAKTIHRAVTTLSEANDKLKKNMKDLVSVSRSLKHELNALWDSVRRTCPELARPKQETTGDSLRDSSKTPEITEISCTVKTFAEDAKTIRRVVSILSEANETLKERLDGEKEIAKSVADEAEKRKLELNDRINRMENNWKKRNEYLASLANRKKNLQELLSIAANKRDQMEERLGTLIDRWKIVTDEARTVLNVESSACDELKHLRLKRTELDDTLSNIKDLQARSSKPLLKALCRIFVWSEAKLQEAQELSVIVKSEFTPESEMSDEQEVVEVEIRKMENMQRDLSTINEKIDTFVNLLESYEKNVKSGVIKRVASVEEKLVAQLEKLSKERKEMKEKLDAMRIRNAKLEKNMDDLRNENKKFKNEITSVSSKDSQELEKFRTLTENLQKELLQLRKENDEFKLKKQDLKDEEDARIRLKEIHNEYEQKLEKIKQKMKTAYNDQVAKLNEEREKALRDKTEMLRVQMEKQCRKYTDDIAKYKAHISDLSSRYWDVGEKLLAESQEKQAALRRIEQFKGSREKYEAIADNNEMMSVAQSHHKTASLDRRDFVADRMTRDGTTRPGYHAVEVIEEETTTYSTRRHSVKSIQAMGNAFKAEDEESELFDSVYLTDLKEGRCAPAGPDFDRLSELRMRNSMCRPHLKSSYAVETHFQPITLNEDDIKNGVNADDLFNDSLSQSLLPGQKPKKRDRTQTSYKRPGPPTPSKNGGRLSLQGNELKSPNSRVLRERNVERRTTATPRGLKNFFGTSISKRQDENATGTPKGRRLSNIFRKQRTERN